MYKTEIDFLVEGHWGKRNGHYVQGNSTCSSENPNDDKIERYLYKQVHTH